MKYAPVIIPTLNRYSHFCQCFESLEKCTGANNTEVFIGLDYPPSEKYYDGWLRIKEYLASKKENNAFYKLTVFCRDHNCGVEGLLSNSSLLAEYALKNYDCFIFSEDDNVFSPNFLEFINKGLDKFKDDLSVLAINGYRHPYPFMFEGNNYFRHNVDFSAWGYGIWSDRVTAYRKEIREDCIFQKNFSKENIKKIKRTGYNRLLDYINFSCYSSQKEERITDCLLSNYMVLKGMHVIMPSISKVRNIGWDESGYSFSEKGITGKNRSIADRHNCQAIDTVCSFDYEGDSFLFYEKNNAIAVENSDGKISVFVFLYRVIKTFIIRFIIKKHR